MKNGPNSLKAYIRKVFGKILSKAKNKRRQKQRRKERKGEKSKTEEEEEEEEEEEDKSSKIRNLTAFSALLLQYISAFIQKSGINFHPFVHPFVPSSSLGEHLLDHLKTTSTTSLMVRDIDKTDGKGQMILVR